MENQSFLITTSTISDNNLQVMLEGQLTIRNAAAIKKELASVLSGSRNLKLVFKNVSRLDLSVLQLLIALSKSTIELDRRLSLDIEQTEYIQSVMQISGMEKILTINYQGNGIH